jgi:hypothetical protein
MESVTSFVIAGLHIPKLFARRGYSAIRADCWQTRALALEAVKKLPLRKQGDPLAAFSALSLSPPRQAQIKWDSAPLARWFVRERNIWAPG